MIIKGISLWQPWAQLVRDRLKRNETRSWRTDYRGPLLICAAKGQFAPAEAYPEIEKLIERAYPHTRATSPWEFYSRLRFGAAICLVDMVACVPTESLDRDTLGNDEWFYGNFAPGRYAHVYEHVRLVSSFPVRGQQGLFDVEVPDELVGAA